MSKTLEPIPQQSLWHKLLDQKLSRRTMLQTTALAGIASGLRFATAQNAQPGDFNASNGAPTEPAGAKALRPPFSTIGVDF